MKNKWAWCLLGILSLGVASSQAQTSADTEKAVTALELQWLQSDKTNNVDLAAPLLADKYVSTGADGKVSDRAATLADQKARKYSTAEYEDLKVTAFGNAAVATGKYRGKGTDASKPFEEYLRWTDTWVKMPDGRWQCVATQYTALK